MDVPRSPPEVVLELAKRVHRGACLSAASGFPEPHKTRYQSRPSDTIYDSDQYALNSRRIEPHERVPLLLISNRRPLRGNRTRLNQTLEARDLRALRVDVLREREVALRVLVPVVHDRLRRERREVAQRGVHLRPGALEEPAAAGDEQRVAREDPTRVRSPRAGRHVVADGVLRVARGGETPVRGRAVQREREGNCVGRRT